MVSCFELYIKFTYVLLDDAIKSLNVKIQNSQNMYVHSNVLDNIEFYFYKLKIAMLLIKLLFFKFVI